MLNWHIRQAVRIIKAGGVIAYPTEAIFGLGCDPLNPYAIEKLLTLKQRDINKGLLLIATNIEQIRPYVDQLDASMVKKILGPGVQPITWLIKANPSVPYWLRGNHPTIGIRIIHHPIATAICTCLNQPIISTSANISHRPPAKRRIMVHKYFHGLVDDIVSGSLGKYAAPSEIRDIVTDQVIRSGNPL